MRRPETQESIIDFLVLVAGAHDGSPGTGTTHHCRRNVSSSLVGARMTLPVRHGRVYLTRVSWRDEWRRQCYRGLNRPALNRDRFFML